MKKRALFFETALVLSGAVASSAYAADFVCNTDNLTRINAIQHTGGASPLDGQVVNVQGVVSALNLKNNDDATLQGFYLQAQNPDADPQTSEGIYIKTDDLAKSTVADIQPGYNVCLQGKVGESYGNTLIDISNDTTKHIVQGYVGQPEAIELTIDPDEALPHAMERYEGMKVRLTANTDMRVTRNFIFDYSSYRNNMVLSRHAPLKKPTQIYTPESKEAVALHEENNQNQLYIDSDLNPESGRIPYMPTFNPETGYIRTGDTVTDLEGVIDYSYGEYRLVPTNEISAGDLIRNVDRLETPALANVGDIRIASFNVLNFFNYILGDADPNPRNQNRGAKTVDEFSKQRTKIVNAITSMNADVIGLIEIENNGFGEHSAIQNLLNAVNDNIKDTNSQYSFIATPNKEPIGDDAISVGLLYRSSKVTPDGSMVEISMPKQEFSFQGKRGNDPVAPENETKGMRNALLQKFKVVANGNLTEGSEFTVVVNHLKSKGSMCKEDYDEYVSPIPLYSSGRINTRSAKHVDGYTDDLQGSCNNFRVAAATELGDYLKNNVTGDILLLGDFNAYGQEDPIKVLTNYDPNGARQIVSAGNLTIDGEPLQVNPTPVTQNYGYIDLNTKLHPKDVFNYSYSYDGELGTLDYALANSSFAAKVVGIEDWHINSLESNLFEYPTRYTGDLEKSDNAFSSSDHDPVLISVNFPKNRTHHHSSGSLSLDWLLILTLLGLKRKSMR